MVVTKKVSEKLSLPLLFLFFILFPFGQILRIELSPFNLAFALHPIDLAAVLSIPVVLINNYRPHSLRKVFAFFWYIAFFSLCVASIVYPLSEVLRGSFYLIRFIAYYFFFELVWNLVKQKKVSRDKILRLLLTSLTAAALFGWIQYFALPDLRFLKQFNWDDHYLRLAGTFLDPGFMGILMVFGALIACIEFIHTKRKWNFVLSIFFLVTCLFTYARAAYLALLAGIFVLSYLHKKLLWFFIVLLVFAGILFVLPRGESEGVKLERTNSLSDKYKNYKETLVIINEHPLLGVGFDTLCSERIRRFGNDSFESHSCSGSDSSLLLVLATTGVIGLFAFVKLLWKVGRQKGDGMYSEIFATCATALLVHSLFLNSLFYPWVMAVIAMLLALNVRESKASK